MKAIFVLSCLVASAMAGTTMVQTPNAMTYSNVQALGRPVYRFTPQITEVRPELRITERTYNVPVPKPVYETKQVTPVHTKYVPEPYTVEQRYAVPQPYAVPTPVNVPVPVAQPVHVQHNVVAQPITYGAVQQQVAVVAPQQQVAYVAPQAQQVAVVSGQQQITGLPAVQTYGNIISPINNAAALTSFQGFVPGLAQTTIQRVELDD